MTNNDELAIRLKAAAEMAMDAWKGFLSLPDDVELERGMSLDDMTLISSHNAASNPANILALLAERDDDKIQLDELESKLSQSESWSLAAQKYIAYLESQVKQLVDESDTDKKRIAELEARTVSVKLPAPIGPEAAPAHYWDNGETMAYADGYNKATSDAKNLCAAAGIKLEVGE